MDDDFDSTLVEPLLQLAHADPEPRVSLAALEAATHFPLEQQHWHSIADSAWRVVFAEPAGSPARREALAFAARIPLRSLREHLRGMAKDDDEPDRDAIADALAAVADPSRIAPLVAGLASGHMENYRLLAAMPLEDRGVSAADLPAPGAQDGDDARFWRALCLARLDDFTELDSVFASDDTLPPLFWGDPWSAHAAIEAVRPVPDAMHDHLLAVLARLDADEAAGRIGGGAARALRLTAWAATGTADAEGGPIRPPHAPRPVVLFGELDPAATAAELAERQLQAAAPQFDDAQVGWMIARERVRDYIPALLAVDRPDLAPEARVRLMQLIGFAADAQTGRALSPYRGAGPSAGGGERPALIDDAPHAAAAAPAAAGAAQDSGDFDVAECEADAGGAGLEDFALDDVDFADLDLDEAEPVSRGGRHLATGHVPSSMGTTQADDSDQQDNRRVNALLLHDEHTHHYFVAGASNTVRCWIGLPQAGIPTANATIPQVKLPPEGLKLVVELCWIGKRDGQPDRHGNGPAGGLHLPAKRTARSEDCDLSFDVPADIDRLEADIVFTFMGKVFEAVRVSAPVLPAGTADDGLAEPSIEVQFGQREVIHLQERTPVSATLTFGPGYMQMFDGSGGKIFDLGNTTPLTTFLNEQLFLKEASLVRRRSQQGVQEGEALLDVDDPDVIELFGNLARHGAALYQKLRGQGFSDPGDRIQLINKDESRHVPLEFVYDRGFPRKGARFCSGWHEALAGDGCRCPSCDAAGASPGGSWSETICPLGFWAIRKVIERFDSAHMQDLSLPAWRRRDLRPLDAALCASTDRVPEKERTDLRKALAESIAAPTIAADWDEWERALAAKSPPLLILLAHHDLDAGLDYLEIGDKALDEHRRWRYRPQLNEALINPAAIEPGPIVLLLGCMTATDVAETGYGSLASNFKDFHASLVLGTMAKVLGRHAGPLACELLAELAAVNTPDADFGSVLRRVRRRMLAHGFLMVLALVAMGDAEWHLPARHQSPAPTPP